MIKAVIFDMDGVLIDAKEWHFQALNRALHLFGYEINRYEHLFTYDGLPTKKKLQMLTVDHGLPIGLHQLVNDLKQIYTMELTYTHCRPVFHHEYALANLKNRGYKLAVASNAIRDTVLTMTRLAGLNQYFDLVLSNQDVVKPKPDPEIYSTAMTRLELQPNECVVVEDNENGLQAARASGAHVMQVRNPNDVTYFNIMKFIGECDDK